MYQFFQYKEELRTAKISATVIVVAFICWGPFFLNLALLTLLGHSSESEGLQFEYETQARGACLELEKLNDFFMAS